VDQQGIYDPVMRRWRRLSVGRPGSYSTSTALADGTVLEVGGINGDCSSVVPAQFQSLALTTLFDASTENRITLGSNAHAASGASGARLSDGRVLVVGGMTDRIPTTVDATASSRIFDLASNEWSPAATMLTARSDHAAVVLENDQILVVGGQNGLSGVFASAERYDPQANAWQAAGSMSLPRHRHTASLLDDGRVLVVGGSNSNATCTCTTFQSAADLYDPGTDEWNPTGSLITARYDHTATRLPDGMVLVAGGFGGTPDTLHASGDALSTVELYDPASGTWASAAAMSTPRSQHTATLLDSGRVLVVGGTDGATTRSSAEVYDPATDTWSPVEPMTIARHAHAALDLGNGKVLIIGGLNESSSTVSGAGSGEVYDPVADNWLTAIPMAVPRHGFVAMPLGDGRALIVGGDPNFQGVPEFYQ
jgi:N-acetylneuraminic acid mutarotase